MNAKKILALLLALVMVLSLGACAPKEEGELAGDLNNDGQIEMGQDGVEVEVNVSAVHMDCVEAFDSGNWEALFTPVDIPERGIDMANMDLTPTAEEKAAMEKFQKSDNFRPNESLKEKIFRKFKNLFD